MSFQSSENDLFWSEDFANEKERYIKVGKAGKGTYGNVYKVYEENNPKKYYAMKKIKVMQNRQDQGFPLTALREIKLLQSLDHKNIIKLQKVITSKKAAHNHNRRSTFLILDYMEHDFYSLLKHATFSYSEIKSFMKQLLEGCAYLHSKKIIHRDLKTRNQLLNNKGELKIADFGLARYHLDHFSELSGNVMTLWYRAPEIIFGNFRYSSKVDIWSVGCIFAELLVKVPIFKGSNVYTQVVCLCERLGEPDENWPEVREYKLWKEQQPKKKYDKDLEEFIKEKFPEADTNCIDQLEQLQTYNPELRISAQTAMCHPFFQTEPLPTSYKKIQKFDLDYHDTLLNELKYDTDRNKDDYEYQQRNRERYNRIMENLRRDKEGYYDEDQTNSRLKNRNNWAQSKNNKKEFSNTNDAQKLKLANENEANENNTKKATIPNRLQSLLQGGGKSGGPYAYSNKKKESFRDPSNLIRKNSHSDIVEVKENNNSLHHINNETNCDDLKNPKKESRKNVNLNSLILEISSSQEKEESRKLKSKNIDRIKGENPSKRMDIEKLDYKHSYKEKYHRKSRSRSRSKSKNGGSYRNKSVSRNRSYSRNIDIDNSRSRYYSKHYYDDEAIKKKHWRRDRQEQLLFK